MKPSDELFRLIKSLTKAEKIHFKKFSKRHVIGESNKYVKLFDEIEKQTIYNEQEIKRSFSGDKFVNQIHVAKNYLFNLILKTLSDFHTEKESDFLLFEYVKEIRILINRNMIRSAGKLIKKAKLMAVQNHNDEILYILLDMEASISNINHTLKAQDNLKKLNECKAVVIRELERTSRYKSINSILNLLSARWSYSREIKDIKAIRKILSDPILRDENKASGFASKYELFSIKAKVYRSLLEDERSLHYSLKSIELMESYPETIRKYPEKFVAKLHEFINYALGTEWGVSKGYPIGQYLQKLKKYMQIVVKSGASRSIKSQCWYYYYQMQIGYYYTLENKEGFYDTMKKIRSEIDIYKENLRTRYLLNLYYYCSIFYFEFGNYDESLKWITLFINHKSASQFEEIYHTLMIYTIILHYELGNYELAESLINNTKRYYRKEEKLFESEKVLLSYLRQLLLTVNDEELVKIYTALEKKLKELSAKDSEKRFLNSFNFERWVEKNINKLRTKRLMKAPQ
jgi:hypothetical protein